MSKIAVFHHIGESGDYTNTIEQILAYDGIITFDGAYTSVWEHRKQLAHKDIVIFVQWNTLGTDGVMTEAQLNELARGYGFHLGWHGNTHRRLTELPDHAVIAELTTPPGWVFVPLYAYPHGDFDERTKQLVKEMGYLRAYSTTQGNDDPFSLHREYV